MTAEEDVWPIPEYLTVVAHTALLTPAIERRLTRMDDRLYRAGMLGAAK